MLTFTIISKIHYLKHASESNMVTLTILGKIQYLKNKFEEQD